MSGTIVVGNRQRARAVDVRLLRRIAQSLIDDLLPHDLFELGICLVAAPEMARLNETFLQHRGPTDVLTFDYSEQPAAASHRIRNGVKSRMALWGGEIFICVEESIAQARRFGTSWQSEMIRYLVHGVLHLAGFDDSNASAQRRMKREEDRILRELSRRFVLAGLARRPRRG